MSYSSFNCISRHYKYSHSSFQMLAFEYFSFPPFCQNMKKVFWICSFNSVTLHIFLCWKHYCLLVFITPSAVLFTDVPSLNHTHTQNLWKRETKIFLCIGGRRISTSHAANLEQDMILEFSDKHLENSTHFLCINCLFHLFKGPAIWP